MTVVLYLFTVIESIDYDYDYTIPFFVCTYSTGHYSLASLHCCFHNQSLQFSH